MGLVVAAAGDVDGDGYDDVITSAQYYTDAEVQEGVAWVFRGSSAGLIGRPPACSDGIDNDGDGASDHPADAGCAAVLENSERDPSRPCDDGLDNDGDGRNDYSVTPDVGDPGCQNASSPREDPRCQDGLNNDGAAGIDFDGGASVNGGVALDVADEQCLWKPWRSSESSTCGLGAELAFLLPALLWLRRGRWTDRP